ncbi:MAG: serine dehydratase beta chain, partial [Bacteroidota bacterium]
MSHEAISTFDIFKIAIGPSSSHTLGPWRAAQKFIQNLNEKDLLFEVETVQILLYGSLAKTGKGHGTDIALQLGLSGYDPVSFPTNQLQARINDIAAMHKIILMGLHEVDFNPEVDIDFLFTESLPFHSNGLTFLATLKNGKNIAETYYSIGGGFIIKENEEVSSIQGPQLSFPINNAGELLHWCIKTGLTIHEIVMENENGWRNEKETRNGLLEIWKVMKECMYRGCHTSGTLPGGLNVKRRAAELNKKLLGNKKYADYDSWVEAI